MDVQALGCDFFAFSGHKVFGPTGVGVLYGRAELLERMPPWQGGGDMIATVTLERSTWARAARQLRGRHADDRRGHGVGRRARVRGVDRTSGHRRVGRGAPGLRHRAGARARRLPDHRHRPAKASVLSFVVDGVHPHDVGAVLDDDGIAIRAGHHCAQPVMQRFGVPATARASFAFYNTRDEIDALVRSLRRVRDGVRLMSSLSELYQNVILEHNRSPRNYRAMEDADRQAEGNNPLCGDQVTVWVRMDGDLIGDVSFQGAGCAISKASASLMTGAVKGKTRAEAEAMFERSTGWSRGRCDPSEAETLGEARRVLGGVGVSDARQMRQPFVAH